MTWLFRPNAILDKTRRTEELQQSERQSTLSRRSFLIKKITCSKSVTIWMLGQHRLDAALFRKEFQQIWIVGCKVVLLDTLRYRPDTA
jgi:hypothetical protein